MPEYDWPANFDVRTDPFVQDRVMPFIDGKMRDLAALDEARRSYAAAHLPPEYRMTYLFHDHAGRVADDMRRTALGMGSGEVAAANLALAMLPHDIGKTALPVDLWDSMDKPDEATKTLRRSHTVKGAAMLDAAFPDASHPFLDLMRDIMLDHHEQMDGGGFRKVPGDRLSLPVRLACIVESFDGYSIPRPHFGERDVSPAGVLNRMRNEKAGALYDMDLFETFAAMKLRQAKGD